MRINDPSIEGLIDIHAHVLPGLDDGPTDLQGALEMARAASEAGTATLVSTPHLRPDFPDVHVEELGSRCASFRELLALEGISLELVSGAEVSLLWALEATDEQLRLASYAQRGTDLLIETPSTNIVGLDRLLYQLRAKGYRVTLAHPERSEGFQRSPGLLDELVAQGILLQVNGEALVTRSHRSAGRRLAVSLCAAGTAHVLASDGHRALSWRPVTHLPEAFRAGVALLGGERAEWMAKTVPAAILAGKAIPIAPPATSAGRFARLFGR